MADTGRIEAPVTDGILEYGKTDEAKEKKSGSSVDKEMFLQLLVAQMKYQDPMQPMDNTQYVSQLATFTQVEEMQNMANSLSSNTANNLVGKYVIMHPTSTTGATSEISGYVDYTVTEGGKTYLSIDGTLYNYDDLYSVVDEEYLDTASIAASFSSLMSALPEADDPSVSLDLEETIASIRQTYNSLSPYQRSYLKEDEVKKLEALEERIAALKEAANSKETASDTSTGSVSSDSEATASEDTSSAADGSDSSTGDTGTSVGE